MGEQKNTHKLTRTVTLVRLISTIDYAIAKSMLEHFLTVRTVLQLVSTVFSATINGTDLKVS